MFTFDAVFSATVNNEGKSITEISYIIRVNVGPSLTSVTVIVTVIVSSTTGSCRCQRVAGFIFAIGDGNLTL